MPGSVADHLSALLVALSAKGFRYLAGHRRDLPRFQAASDKAGFQIRSTHYYEPTYRASDLPADIEAERSLPGLDFRESQQLALLNGFRWQAELQKIPMEKPAPSSFGYLNGAFESGESEVLYSLIRQLRPGKIIEVGSGESTLMARLAIQKNGEDDDQYRCEHTCIEPYEAPWLESSGVRVIRDRVENVSPDLFSSLGANDILFIDSSHVIRPFGDVLDEYQQIIPALAPGVYVHVHDVFTPYDYPAYWLREDRRGWNEQYLLESFLAFNAEFEVVAMLNWLSRHHRPALIKACPTLAKQPDFGPSSFWFRRRSR